MWIKERGWWSWEPCSCWSHCISQSCSWTSFISTPWHHQLHSFCHTSSSSSSRRIPLKLILQWHGSSSCWFNQSVIKYFPHQKAGQAAIFCSRRLWKFFPWDSRNFQRQSTEWISQAYEMHFKNFIIFITNCMRHPLSTCNGPKKKKQIFSLFWCWVWSWFFCFFPNHQTKSGSRGWHLRIWRKWARSSQLISAQLSSTQLSAQIRSNLVSRSI